MSCGCGLFRPTSLGEGRGARLADGDPGQLEAADPGDGIPAPLGPIDPDATPEVNGLPC